MITHARRFARSLVLVTFAVGCTQAPPDGAQRGWTDDFEVKVTPDVVPPRALEPTMFTVVVKDKKTHQPIINGQGRIFATNADGKSINDGFAYGPEVGTYHAKLMFLTAGEWAVGLQFRRDSTQLLQRTLDWRQVVRPAAEPGEPAKP